MARSKQRATRRKSARTNYNSDVAIVRAVPQSSIYNCVRTVNLGVITATSIDSGVGRRFRLGDLPVVSDYTNLFDQYRILKVEVIYVLSTHILASQARYPRLTFAVDYSDASNPGSENDILSYQNCETFQFGQVKHTFKRVFRPRAAMAAFEGAFTGYGMAPADTWFDCNDSNIEHYGTKEWINNYNTTAATGAVINVYHRYHLQFKNAR